MLTPNIRAVLFDWDQTLIWIAERHRTSWRVAQQFQRAGLDYTPEEIERATSERTRRIRAGQLKGPLELVTRCDIIVHYHQLLHILGAERRNRSVAIAIYNALGNLPVYPFPDTLETLQTLQRRRYRLGLISNNGRTSRTNIESALCSLMAPRHMFLSEEEGVHKPCPRLFLRAAGILGVPPERCVFVGDNPRVDALAAVNSGYAHAFWVDRGPNGGSVQSPGARVTRITSLGELLNYLG